MEHTTNPPTNTDFSFSQPCRYKEEYSVERNTFNRQFHYNYGLPIDIAAKMPEFYIHNYNLNGVPGESIQYYDTYTFLATNNFIKVGFRKPVSRLESPIGKEFPNQNRIHNLNSLEYGRYKNGIPTIYRQQITHSVSAKVEYTRENGTFKTFIYLQKTKMQDQMQHSHNSILKDMRSPITENGNHSVTSNDSEHLLEEIESSDELFKTDKKTSQKNYGIDERSEVKSVVVKKIHKCEPQSNQEKFLFHLNGLIKLLESMDKNEKDARNWLAELKKDTNNHQHEAKIITKLSECDNLAFSFQKAFGELQIKQNLPDVGKLNEPEPMEIDEDEHTSPNNQFENSLDPFQTNKQDEIQQETKANTTEHQLEIQSVNVANLHELKQKTNETELANKEEALQKLEDLKYETEIFLKEIDKFEGTANDKQYIYLDEMITRVLLKVDNVEIENDMTVRLKRKECIRYIKYGFKKLRHKVNKT